MALDLPPQIEAIAVAQDDLVAVLPVGHRLAPRARLTWQDLAGERLALFARGSTYELAMATLRQHGADLARADQLLLQRVALQPGALRAGGGRDLAAVHPQLARRHREGCARCKPLSSRARWPLMVHAAQDARPPLVQSCLEFLTQALRNA